MSLRSLLPLAASAALFLSTGRASAEEDPGLRGRANFALEGGPVVIPRAVTLGQLGASFQLGVQFNDFVAVYAAGSVSWMFGKGDGNYAAAAVLGDFTFNDAISIGVGPELGLLIAGARGLNAWDAVVGGRLHFAWYPYLYRNEARARRGLTLGVDTHLVAGAPGFLVDSGFFPQSFHSHGSFAFLPVAYVGWSVF